MAEVSGVPAVPQSQDVQAAQSTSSDTSISTTLPAGATSADKVKEALKAIEMAVAMNAISSARRHQERMHDLIRDSQQSSGG